MQTLGAELRPDACVPAGAITEETAAAAARGDVVPEGRDRRKKAR